MNNKDFVILMGAMMLSVLIGYRPAFNRNVVTAVDTISDNIVVTQLELESSEVIEDNKDVVEEEIIEYVEVTGKYVELDGITPPEFTGEVVTYIGELLVTDEDVWFLQVMCMGEAAEEPYVGKIAVCETAINRARIYGTSITEQITAENQYYTGCSREPNEECLRAVDHALYEEPLYPEDMTLFKLNGYHPKSYSEPYAIIGSHYFSCIKG